MSKKMRAGVEMARANLLEAEAAGVRAEREYERSRKLKEYGLITQQNLEDAQTAREAAQARVSAAQAQLQAAQEDFKQSETRLVKAVIRAPMDGVISLRGVNVGDLAGEVGAPKVMFKMVDNRLLDLIATVPSHETAMLKVGQPLIFTTDAIPGKKFSGRVRFINPAVNQLDRSVQISVEVSNAPEALKGGLFVQGKIITNQKKGVLQVPRTAFASWDVAGKEGAVFATEGGIARRRQVKTGITGGDMVEITGGLSAGDRIIVRGGFNVKDGDSVKTIGTPGGD
jgi:RND family efflux transporter MFP subunit